MCCFWLVVLCGEFPFWGLAFIAGFCVTGLRFEVGFAGVWALLDFGVGFVWTWVCHFGGVLLACLYSWVCFCGCLYLNWWVSVVWFFRYWFPGDYFSDSLILWFPAFRALVSCS